MKKLFILAAIAATLTACNQSELAYSTSGNTGILDTVTIHNRPHEFIRFTVKKGGSMVHSPECWCLKGGNQ